MDLVGGNQIQVTAASDAFASKLEDAKRAADGGDTEKAVDGFEKLLATQLVREMSRTLTDGFFGSGPGADTFTGWLEEHLGSALAESRALGLSEALRASLLSKGAEGQDR
ncbi:MAG: rod-binding protein [Planctomycetota bacterium]